MPSEFRGRSKLTMILFSVYLNSGLAMLAGRYVFFEGKLGAGYLFPPSSWLGPSSRPFDF
ncbi:hypothetical protein M405DRAFT_834979 [Rhizopogon salebrosus TDB-379]|nr:hypothetical protein M405DRAFT_834979 [Rhizopogon salebrosus TDB-379]